MIAVRSRIWIHIILSTKDAIDNLVEENGTLHSVPILFYTFLFDPLIMA